MLCQDQLSTSYSQITVLIGSELSYVHHATGLGLGLRYTVYGRYTRHTTLVSSLAHCIGRRPNITALMGHCLMEVPAYLDLTRHRQLPADPLPSSVTAPPARCLH